MSKNHIALEDFKKEETERVFVLNPELFSNYQGDGLDVRTPVEVKLRFIKFGQDYNIRGTIRTTVLSECSRCLSEFDIPIEATFNNIYTQTPAENEDTEVDIGEVDLETSVLSEGQINLVELVYEQLILQLPIKPLCRDECKGLCPQCGQDLNVEQCGCSQQDGDPRFSLLEQFFTEPEGPETDSQK